MLTRQIIQIRATLGIWLIVVLVSVSFLPSYAPPAYGSAQPLTGSYSPGNGGPDEPDDQNPGGQAMMRTPPAVAVPIAQKSPDQFRNLRMPSGWLARWMWIVKVVVKGYWLTL